MKRSAEGIVRKRTEMGIGWKKEGNRGKKGTGLRKEEKKMRQRGQKRENGGERRKV